jgi:hypothetical protein
MQQTHCISMTSRATLARMIRRRLSSPRGEIRNFLIAIAAGTALAAAAVVAGRYYFDRRGVYNPANLLLLPEMMGNTIISDRDPETHVRRDWSFDQVELASLDGERRLLPREVYRELYSLVAKQPSEPARLRFFENGVYRLHISLSPAGRYAASYEPHLFQQVEVTEDGQHMRIQLLFGRDEIQWVYFKGVGEPLAALLRERSQ